jgi:single-stranded-DNA-specific exonuclease
LLADVARAGPFGAGHAEPVFAVPSHTIAYAEEVGQAHVRARLRGGDGTMLNAIAFRAAGKPLGQALLANRGQSVHAAGTLSVDRFNGQERVQLRLMDLAKVEPAGR